MSSSTLESIPSQVAPEQAPSAAEAFVGRVFETAVGAFDLFAIELGVRLGLYAALRDGGPSTAAELAARAGIGERYAREWLEQQAVSDILAVDDAGRPAHERRYELPADLVAPLLDPTDPNSIAPIAAMFPVIGLYFDQLVEAYRTGSGIAWSDFPTSMVHIQAAFNRPAYLHDLAGWFAAVPAVDERLRGRTARVADTACGAGWSTQAIAAAYPQVVVEGFDIDDTSIALARRNLAGTGVEGRVSFEVSDLSEPAETPYDVITMFEALHDLSHPVEVLRSLRQSLLPDGVVLVMDERTADEFTAPGDPMERLFYGCSVLLCLPGSLADGGVGTGTAIRSATVEHYAAAAGFASCEVADVEHPMFRFYVLRG